MIESYCGIDCSKCGFRESMGCKGCVALKGNTFWQNEQVQCEIAACVKEKGIRFCGECGSFPCEKAERYAYDQEQGDGGARLENCKLWKRTLVKEARQGIDVISICGHHCDYCFMGEWCGGCRSNYNCCSFGTTFPDGVCPNVACAREQNLDGCYDCPSLLNCKKGYYKQEEDGEYIAKATALFIHQYGKEVYTKVLQAAIADGVEYAKDFDATGSVKGALHLLEKYRK